MYLHFEPHLNRISVIFKKQAPQLPILEETLL